MGGVLLNLADDFPNEVFEILNLYLLGKESNDNTLSHVSDDLYKVFQQLKKSNKINEHKFRGLISNLLQKGKVFSRLNDL